MSTERAVAVFATACILAAGPCPNHEAVSELRPAPGSQLHILTRPYARGSPRHAVPAIMWRWLEHARGLSRDADAGVLPRIYVHTRHIPDDVYPRLYLREFSQASSCRPASASRVAARAALLAACGRFALLVTGCCVPTLTTPPGADAVVLPTRGEGWGRPQMEVGSGARALRARAARLQHPARLRR